jgi:hypothetical protein
MDSFCAMQIFEGRKLLIATMHGKERVLAPILERELGVQTFISDKFDSDVFGTFTGEIERDGDQAEACKRKLLHAMEIEKCDLGLANEGAFWPDRVMPFLHIGQEIVMLIDKKNDLEIVAEYRSASNFFGLEVTSVEEAIDFAERVGFPEQGIIVRRKRGSGSGIFKDIRDIEELKRVVEANLSKWFRKSCFLETDMRAHRNPTRMKAIGEAGEMLVENILSLCDECSTPGFSVKEVVPGLECNICSMPTDLPKGVVRVCRRCGHKKVEEPVFDESKSIASFCEFCNP